MSGDEADAYVSRQRKRLLILVGVTVASVAIALCSISVISFHISLQEAWGVVIKHLQGVPLDSYYDRIRDEIIFKGTLPRALGSLIIGAILGVSGAVMQYCVRNPLADPYTTGISSAALFGVTISLALGIMLIPGTGNIGLIVNAFVFAMIPCAIMIAISVRRKTTPTMLILIGIGVMYLFTALTMVMKFNAEPEILEQIIAWSIGSTSKVNWDAIPYLLFSLAVLLTGIAFYSSRLDVMSSGENTAISLGADPKRTRLICMVIVSACTAIAVSFCGSIGFVGLIVPHISRLLVGSKSRALIPCSAAVGALILVIADVLSRSFGAGLPVGAITAVIGSPVFLYFLIKMKTGGWGR